MAMKLAGKRIIVTGAASGIGQALVHQLATYDAHIIVADIDVEALQNVLHALSNQPAQIATFAGDLAQPEVIDQLFEFADAQMGGIDLFIANAGIAYYETLQDADWQHIDRIYRLNVYSPIYSAQKMKTLYGDQPYKVVITASSIGFFGLPGYALYSSTKAALHRFAEAYRFELAQPHQLTLAYPISTRTNFFESAAKLRAPMVPPSQTADYVAMQMIRGIQRDQKSIHTSRIFQVTLLLERVFPPVRWLILSTHKLAYRRWRKRAYGKST